MRRVLELYASLVDYPDELFIQDLASLELCLRRVTDVAPALRQLELFKHSVENLSLDELQELYTSTFDLSPVCSLHVGYHLFGESYKRGSLMARLREDYQSFGLQEGSEIPDHLAQMLKYCAYLSVIEQEREVYEELLTLIVFPGVEKMVALFAETTNPYKFLLGSLAAWLAEQCGASLASKTKMR